MPTYYISPSGVDTNNGLGPDASHATNKPWLTINKAMATGSPVLPGDIVYIGPGVYYNAGGAVPIVPISGITSTASPTTFEGDPDNRQGFKDGSGVRLAPGICHVTTRTSTNGLGGTLTDTSHLFGLSTNGPDGLIFRNLSLEADPLNGFIFLVNWATVTTLLVEDCRLSGNSVIGGTAGAPTAARNWTIRRCVVIGGTLLSGSNSNAAATADADLAVLFENNLLLGARIGQLALGASGGNIAGGIIFRGNTIFGTGSSILNSLALRVSTVTPCRVERNIAVGAVWVSAGTAGHFVDDGRNVDCSQAASVNFTPAGTSISSPAMLLNLPDLIKWGLALPVVDALGWAPEAAASVRRSGGTSTLADFRNRTVRPWGNGGPSVGCWESADLSQDTTSAITGGGANSLKLIGAGEVSLFIPVKAAATTITIITKSTSYGGTDYPQAILEPSGSLGYAGGSDTAVAATEETLSIGPFTPSVAGVIELRLVSRSTTPSSATYFDVLV
jgi:hypothetical protein